MIAGKSILLVSVLLLTLTHITLKTAKITSNYTTVADNTMNENHELAANQETNLVNKRFLVKSEKLQKGVHKFRKRYVVRR